MNIFRRRPGFIYLMYLNGLHKIGSSNDPVRRSMEGNVPLKIVCAMATDNMADTEDYFHALYRRCRVLGVNQGLEWFDLPEGDVTWLASMSHATYQLGSKQLRYSVK